MTNKTRQKPPAFTLPVQILKAASITEASNDVRYYLNGIFVKHDRICSTDGHTLFINWVKDWPEGFDVSGLTDGVIIRIHGSIPRGAAKAEFNPTSGKAGIVNYSFNRKASIHLGAFEIIDGIFPDVDRVLKTKEQEPVPVTQIGFNPTYLGRLQQLSKVMVSSPLAMKFFGPDKAAFAEIQHPTWGLSEYCVMPMRL